MHLPSDRPDAMRRALDGLDAEVLPDWEALKERVSGLGEKRRARMIRAALKAHFAYERKRPFEAELVKAQRFLRAQGRKVVVVVEGRDAAGKGGLIHRITRGMEPDGVRVVALGKPTPEQELEPYFQRYSEKLPRSGEMVWFDRSWYGRALVEPVMGFCTPDEYEAFMTEVGPFESALTADGTTILVKVYISVSCSVQAQRFRQRGKDPWRLSEVDRQAQARWGAYTEHKAVLLRRTQDPVPWWVVRSDRRAAARMEVMKLVLRQIPYPNRSRTLRFQAHPDLCLSGEEERKRMES